jgi:hypothetical protein
MRFNLPRGFLGVIAFAALAMQTDECFGLIETAIPGFNEADEAISRSNDPLVKSASEAPGVVSEAEQWQMHVTDAFANLALDSIDKAIAIMPNSNTTRYNKAVLLIALGRDTQDVNAAIKRANDVSAATTGGWEPENGSLTLIGSLSDALGKGALKVGTPEGDRVHKYLCDYIAATILTKSTIGGDVSTERFYQQFSNCPR